MQPNEKKQLEDLIRNVEDLTKTVNDFIRCTETNDVGVGKDIEQIQKDIAEIKVLVTTNYVRREEFNPVQKIVYGMVSVLLVAVLGALVALVLK